jgi:two-component SAPR family response regulator
MDAKEYERIIKQLPDYNLERDMYDSWIEKFKKREEYFNEKEYNPAEHAAIMESVHESNEAIRKSRVKNSVLTQAFNI